LSIDSKLSARERAVAKKRAEEREKEEFVRRTGI
jgi:hypothetical protein